MDSDLTFITNEENSTLLERFKVLIKNTRFFDVLVGYFYTSGFHALYKSLEATEKTRILIGINTDRITADSVLFARKPKQLDIEFSHSEVKDLYQKNVVEELEESDDSKNVENGITKFIEWIRNGKLEIRAYPNENIHAKLYIMTFAEGDRDKGRVITGSSNFTYAGLVDNLEFNVELKNRADYEFALAKFNQLWENSVDVSDEYIDTIQRKTWVSDTITPYELYLKFLYEYFQDQLKQADELELKYIPEEFKKLEYQTQSVLDAKKKLEEYGGVFISDVVGLGKTYVAAMLAGQLEGRTLVLAPPVLLNRNNPGSWPNVFFDFRVSAEYESVGKLDHLIRRGTEKYQNIIIDEAHRFRTETNVTYEKLAEICRGKRVILVTATPYNNSPLDILSQIKLFQNSRKSTIPNLPDLESFFKRLDKRLQGLDRQKDYDEYMRIIKLNADEIRDKVLKYIMVRRTRTEITNYFPNDLANQGLKFPEVADPEPFFYELNEEEDRIFSKTVDLITKKFSYARYMPLLYYTGMVKIDQLTRQSQRNMGRFMKVLLIKRLESSFFAFRNTVNRFIHSHKRFIEEYDKGSVYVSKNVKKIFELLEEDNDEAVQKLIDEGKAEKYPSSDFRESLKKDLQKDLDILNEIKELWKLVDRDPKLIKFIDRLSNNTILKQSKLIIFTESKETAEYLEKNIKKDQSGKVICFHGSSKSNIRDKIIDNFDARAKYPRNDYRILISTEVLAEGVNLHQSNAVINYDIPWNPTRMMQRVGRINRIDTKFDKIYTFNFFPTKQSNDQIKLKEAAEAKINAFISLLGADAKLLTQGEEVASHGLYDRLTSAKSLTDEDGGESELKYLKVIKDIREEDKDLFNRIKMLPKKARTGKINAERKDSLITYFRKDKIQKFFMATSEEESQELDFMTAAKILESTEEDEKKKVGEDYFELLDKNKDAFDFATAEDTPEVETRRGRDSLMQMLGILKASLRDRRQFTEDQEQYIKTLIRQLEDGAIPKQTAKTTVKALKEEIKKGINPLRILAVLKKNIADNLLTSHVADTGIKSTGKREVILSEYFLGN